MERKVVGYKVEVNVIPGGGVFLSDAALLRRAEEAAHAFVERAARHIDNVNPTHYSWGDRYIARVVPMFADSDEEESAE